MKKWIYKSVLKMMLKDRSNLSITGKQKSQIECLIQKCKKGD